MQPELLDYIETLIKSDIGLVEQDPELIVTNYPDMIKWLMENCYQSTVVVSFEKLNTHWEGIRPNIINKKRYFFLNEKDFKSLDIPELKGKNDEFKPYLVINETVTVYDEYVKQGEIYWCTPDEFQIIKAN